MILNFPFKEAETVVATGAGMAEGVGMATGVDTTDVKDIIPHPGEEDIMTSLPIKEWEVVEIGKFFLEIFFYEAAKSGFFSENEVRFSNLQKEITPNHCPELEIWNSRP